MAVIVSLMIMAGFWGCNKDEQGNVVEEKGQEVQLEVIDGNEEFKKYKMEHIEKVKKIANEELGFKVDVTTGDTTLYKPGEKDEDKYINVSVGETDDRVNFFVYEYNFVEETIKFVKKYFEYDFDIDEIIKELENKGEYLTKDEGYFHYEDGKVTFDKLIANCANITVSPLQPIISKEEVESHNIYNNGKLDKIIKDTNTNESKINVGGVDQNFVGGMSVYLVGYDAKLYHSYTNTDGELMLLNKVEVNCNTLDDFKSKIRGAEIKSLFASIYDEPSIYNEIIKNIDLLDKSNDDSLIISMDKFGYNNISIFRELESGEKGVYRIEIEHLATIK